MQYSVSDKPRLKELIVFALQQLLAIVAGTIAVPVLIGKPELVNAALLGCGIGTIVYILITKRKSPVILSSNFAFIGALIMASEYGYLGILLGGLVTGLVYVLLAILVKVFGTAWIEKLLPPIVIGPVVALIGLTLAGSAVSDLIHANGYLYQSGTSTIQPYNLLSLSIGLLTFFSVVIFMGQNRNKGLKLIPFLIAIVLGYLVSLLFSMFGYIFDVPYLKIIDFSPLTNNFTDISYKSFIDFPRFSLYLGIEEIARGLVKLNGIGVLEVILLFGPISLVSFSEHIADHKNLSSVIGINLLEDPGLDKTLLGDGIGSIAGTVFGICPNTTYSQSIGCVALSKNASVITVIVTSIMCIFLSFLTPVSALLRTIPSCVMGGICLSLYGFIAVSGFKMLRGLDLSTVKNMSTLSVIFVTGIGGLSIQIPYKFETVGNVSYAVRAIEIGQIAVALILGIITYLITSHFEKKEDIECEEEV